MAQYHLHQVDVCHGLQPHVELLHPHVAVGIEVKSVEVLVDLDGTLVSGKQFLWLIEGVREAGAVMGSSHHRLASVGSHLVVGGGFVDANALYAVGWIDVVPCQNVPVAIVVVGREVFACDGMLVGSVVWSVGREARVVAANLKGFRLGIAQLAEEFHVGGIPVVFPFRLPVVRYVVLELVVPDGL